MYEAICKATEHKNVAEVDELDLALAIRIPGLEPAEGEEEDGAPAYEFDVYATEVEGR